jgi:hypothetical protein
LNEPVEVHPARARAGEPLEEALARAELHDLVGLSGDELAAPSRAALAWDGRHLAARVLVESQPPLRVRVVTPHGPVFEDECVELFVGSAQDPTRYLEVVVNPLGVAYVARVVNPNGSRASWLLTPGVRVAGLVVSAYGEPHAPEAFRRWSATIEVPWHAVGGPPEPGEERRANVTRIGRGRITRFEALSPTFRAAPPDFHVPAAFARLVF